MRCVVIEAESIKSRYPVEGLVDCSTWRQITGNTGGANSKISKIDLNNTTIHSSILCPSPSSFQVRHLCWEFLLQCFDQMMNHFVPCADTGEHVSNMKMARKSSEFVLYVFHSSSSPLHHDLRERTKCHKNREDIHDFLSLS